jgi:hypothetical protein
MTAMTAMTARHYLGRPATSPILPDTYIKPGPRTGTSIPRRLDRHDAPGHLRLKEDPNIRVTAAGLRHGRHRVDRVVRTFFTRSQQCRMLHRTRNHGKGSKTGVTWADGLSLLVRAGSVIPGSGEDGEWLVQGIRVCPVV